MSRQGTRSAAAAARIEVFRKAAGLSVEELAARTGIPRSTLNHHLKRAPHLISVPDFEDIAAALDVPFEALFALDPVAAA